MENYQEIIVVLLFIASSIYFVRKLYKTTKTKDKCAGACNCSGKK